MSGAVHTFAGKVLVALDMLLCVVWTRDADVTISAMLDVKVNERSVNWFEKLVYNTLNRVEADHCNKARLNDIGRAQAAIEVLQLKVKP